MRQPSKAELLKERDDLRGERDTAIEALYYLNLGEAPDSIEAFDYEGSHYARKLYGSTRAHGGIVVSVFSCAGQRDQLEVSRLDDLSIRTRAYPHTECLTLEKIAIERLEIARNRTLNRYDPTHRVCEMVRYGGVPCPDPKFHSPGPSYPEGVTP